MSVEFADKLKNDVDSKGRLFLFLSENPNVEPRTQTWPNPVRPTHIFAINLDNLNPENILKLDGNENWTKTVDWSLNKIPEGEYFMQVVWDQDFKESRIDAPGNLYSTKQKLDKLNNIEIIFDNKIPEREINNHPLAKVVTIASDTLSAWWGKEMQIKASVLLPRNYDATAKKAYPIRYNVAGYGGRYTRINNLLRNQDFMEWWTSDQAPEVINVFLDGEGPFGDSYQMDSENSGPYGYSLVNELMPYIEQKYRGTQTAATRFVDGCSTGGWVSLGLQLYYPDVFNGVFSYSPDAIEFENYQLINIYKDENAFVNEFGFPRPVMRDLSGEPMLTVEDFIDYENTLGYSGTYLNSGGQFSAHSALYGPKGNNGLPAPLFDPESGDINSEVAEHWKKYDFKLYTEKNWAELGPKLRGKIYVWMGDMDHFYLNPATRSYHKFLQELKNPVSDAVIEFSPMEGHCAQFSNKEVLIKIQDRLKNLGYK
jgi:S-formylglutathione hydrolase FrmB